jgi:uncharacterized protein (DUF433 family)
VFGKVGLHKHHPPGFDREGGGVEDKPWEGDDLPVACGYTTEGNVKKLAEIERELSLLSSSEKAQVLQWIVRDLGQAFPGIESTPGVCGGEPCIVRTRIPVWVLEQMRRLGVSEVDILRAYPTLRAEDLANAWAFVLTHSEDIERQIRENEES